jgi:hypothetical protein
LIDTKGAEVCVFRTTLLAGLLCLLPIAAQAAGPPPRPLPPAALTRLVEQLGHRDYRLREQAERELYLQGQAVLPLLRKAVGHKDAEVRRRAMRLLPGLEHAALVSPRRVTLSVTNKPLRVVLEELSKASGYKVMLNGMMMPGGPGAAGEDTHSYQFVNTPFWEVVDRICRDSNSVVQQSYGDEIVRLNQGGGHAPHVGRDGAFRYAAASFQMYRNVDLSLINPRGGTAVNRSENLTFSFNLFAEPRLPFLGMGEVRLESAYDSERNSMLIKTNHFDGPGGPFGGVGRRYYGGGGYKQHHMQVSVNLYRPSEKATMLKLLKGVVPVTLLVEQKPMVLSDKILSAKGTKKKVGDLEFNIENVQKMANNQVQIKFTVANKGNATDYMWMNTLYQRLELQDEKGNKFQNWGSSWGGNNGNSVQMTLTFGHFGAGKAPTPARLVYQHWVTRQHDVHFEFKGVPLP